MKTYFEHKGVHFFLNILIIYVVIFGRQYQKVQHGKPLFPTLNKNKINNKDK